MMKSFLLIIFAALIFTMSCEIMPRNTLSDCREQCKDGKKSKACLDFCNCIHKDGRPLDSCLNEYNKAPEDSVLTIIFLIYIN